MPFSLFDCRIAACHVLQDKRKSELQIEENCTRLSPTERKSEKRRRKQTDGFQTAHSLEGSDTAYGKTPCLQAVRVWIQYTRR